MRREELDGEVSGSQIEQSAGELILLASISPADPPRLPLADHVQRIARSANSSSGNQTLIQCFKCCDRQSWLPTWMTFQGTTRSRKTGPMSILIIPNDYNDLISAFVPHRSRMCCITKDGPAGASQQKVTVSILKLIGETEGSARLLCKIRVNHAMTFRNSQRPRFSYIDC
jgi:hypothetical protein